MLIHLLADTSLPQLASLFPPPFVLTRFKHPSELPTRLIGQQVLLCRSTLPVNEALLHASTLKYVATASSGTDHIDETYLTAQSITLLDAKGCNAQAVTDYVRLVLTWLKTKGLPHGKKAGVFGVGAVGSLVATLLHALGFEVCCVDPYQQTLRNAHPYVTLKHLTDCDLICIHANLHHTPPFSTTQCFNASFFDTLKPGTTIINAARGGIVDETALIKCLNPLYYCTDVYQHEPHINPNIIEKALLCTPHIAGHTVEAKNAAVESIARQLHQLYQLPFSPPLKQNIPSTQTTPTLNSNLLSMYDPSQDTLALKQTTNHKTTFLTRRNAHQRTHL